MNKYTIYMDTSVFGGYYDPKFSESTRDLFQEIYKQQYEVVISKILLDELIEAPEEVQELLSSIPEACLTQAGITNESKELRNEYLSTNIINQNHAKDAHHVAIATCGGANLIVSWNFKHIVNFEKIRGFNSVNIRMGYNEIDIRSPLEVIT